MSPINCFIDLGTIKNISTNIYIEIRCSIFFIFSRPEPRNWKRSNLKWIRSKLKRAPFICWPENIFTKTSLTHFCSLRSRREWVPVRTSVSNASAKSRAGREKNGEESSGFAARKNSLVGFAAKSFARARKCVYLSANRFPTTWKDGIRTSSFVFRLPTPSEKGIQNSIRNLIFDFRFSLVRFCYFRILPEPGEWSSSCR